MKKQIIVGLLIALTLYGVLGGVKAYQISSAIAEAKARKQPPEAVTSFTARQEIWSDMINTVGSLVAVQGATLSVEMSGTVSAIHFNSGDKVSKGDVLLSLNTSVEEADLRKAKATFALAEQNASRQRALRKRNANAQADLDNAEESLENARAELNRMQAIVDRKRVIAPFDGHTGIRMVNIGQMIEPGTPIVELNAYSPLYINFSIPQKQMGMIAPGDTVHVTVDAYPGETFTATVTAIGSKIDPTMRTMEMQATLQNEQRRLRPGMFVNVQVISQKREPVIVIPSSSINYAPYGSTVYVIGEGAPKEGRPVNSQVVNTGKKRGDLIAITSGLNVGDEVVSSGTFKLRPGATVIVNNSVTPSADEHPDPEDS